jgi:hypothetical protein
MPLSRLLIASRHNGPGIRSQLRNLLPSVYQMRKEAGLHVAS